MLLLLTNHWNTDVTGSFVFFNQKFSIYQSIFLTKFSIYQSIVYQKFSDFVGFVRAADQLHHVAAGLVEVRAQLVLKKSVSH
jgi:hypothetical protein